MAYSATLVTPPSEAALTLDDVKLHLNLDHEDDDDLVEALIDVAQQHLDGPDGILSAVLLDSQWSETLDIKGCKVVELQRSPVSAINTVTLDGAEQTGNWTLRHRDTGKSILLFSAELSGELVVTYQAGYADAASVPAPLKHAMKLHISSLYEHREQEATAVNITSLPHYDALVGPYRRRRVG